MRQRVVPRSCFAAVVWWLAYASHVGAAEPRDPGAGVLRLRSTTFLSDRAYDDDGARRDEGAFVTETITAHAELGIAPLLTLAASLPAVWIAERAEWSGGDAVVGGLLALPRALTGDVVTLAGALDLKLPLYSGGPTVRGRAPDGLPAVGDGQVDMTAGAVLVALLPGDGALEVNAGYRFRTADVTDAVVGGGRIGWWLLDRRFFASTLLDTVVTFDAAEGSSDVVGRGWAAVGGRLSVRVVDRTFLEVSGAYVGRGTNAAGGWELGFGATTSF